MGPKKPPEPEPEPEPVEVEPQKGTGFFTMPDGSTYGTFGPHSRAVFSVRGAVTAHSITAEGDWTQLPRPPGAESDDGSKVVMMRHGQGEQICSHAEDNVANARRRRGEQIWG